MEPEMCRVFKLKLRNEFDLKRNVSVYISINHLSLISHYLYEFVQHLLR